MCVAACGESRTPLEQLLADLEERVEERDAAGVTELLAADFAAPEGLTRATVRPELERYFFAYDSLDVTISEVTADEAGTKVSLRADVSGHPKEALGIQSLVPDGSAHRFEFALAKEGGALRIRAASWERLDRH
jgi:hypothetical protein